MQRKHWILVHSVNGSLSLIMLIQSLSADVILAVAFAAFGVGIAAAMLIVNLFMLPTSQPEPAPTQARQPSQQEDV
jgi:hypothetical protein